jgi:hypothetical protein
MADPTLTLEAIGLDLELSAETPKLQFVMPIPIGVGESNELESVNTGGGVGTAATVPKIGQLLRVRGIKEGTTGLVTVGLDSGTEEIIIDIDTDALMTDLNPQLITLVDESGTLTYVGQAETGTATSAASWRIYLVDETGSGDEELIKLYADGSTDFDQVWDDRTSLTYS